MKKSLAITTLLLIMFSPLGLGEITSITEHKGLQKLAQDKVENGSHVTFDNVYITDESNIRIVKGRDKLNTTANADTTVNMLCYYENAAGTTKKYIVKESDEVVTYDTDWTGRTSILGSLTNEKGDCVQIGDILYINSSTDGLHKWTGSGSATAITGVSTPSSVSFGGTSDVGGMTPGLPIGVTANLETDTTCAIPSTATSGTGCLTLQSNDTGGQNVSSDTGTLEQPNTTSTYNYKITTFNSKYGIESQPSSESSVSLIGDYLFTWAGTGCSTCDTNCQFGGSGCNDGTNIESCCTGVEYVTSGQRTSTIGTLAGGPSFPFDQFCVYRTVAGGDEYFLVGCPPSNSSTFTDGKPDSSLTRPLDTTIDTTAPPSFRYVEEYKGTLFTAENNQVRFTRLPVAATTDADKYWLSTDLLKTGLRKPITGLHTVSNNILIFSSNNVLALSGFGVDSFRLANLLTGIGAASDESIVTDTNGDVIFFAGVQGVYKLRVGQQLTDDLTGAVVDQPNTNVVRISSPFLDDVFRGEDADIDLDPADYGSAHAYYDIDNDFYWLYIGEDAFIFNNKSAQWSHVPASKMSASVYRSSPNAAGQALVIDDLGFAYDNWKGYENGIESGTVTGNPTSSGATTLTDSGASYSTTGDGLAGVWVFVDNEVGEYRQIQSNTGTVLTVSPAWDVNPTTTDDYYIGYIVVDFITKQYSFVQPPLRNKVDNIYLVHSKSDSSQDLELISYQNKDTVPNNLKAIDLSDKFVDKRAMPMGNGKFWYQWQGRSFVYNTSNTINPPIEIQSYAVDWQETEEL